VTTVSSTILTDAIKYSFQFFIRAVVQEKNSITQPYITNPVFNNWDVVAKGWYLLCRSSDILRTQVQSFDLCGQRIVVFRGNDDSVKAMDAFCPHMGADLGIGKVVDNSIQCFFHHWQYDGTGSCIAIPCSEKIPPQAKLQSYGVAEKYGHIWVYPDANPPVSVPEYDDWIDKEVYWELGDSVHRSCHHHVNMINGIDAQHLRTVHNISIDMKLQCNQSEDGLIMDYTLTGPLPKTTIMEKFVCWVLGGTYAYSMRYGQSTVGLLSVMEKVNWFGSQRKASPLRMVFAYTPIENGVCRTVPIFLAEKKSGLFGYIKAKFLLLFMKIGFSLLRDEDGAVYDNIRFQPNTLLSVDKPVAQYIKWVNSLPLSKWSTTSKNKHCRE
jgi:nitrite reductase/ring-hydroxylating ferredoxin subunit